LIIRRPRDQRATRSGAHDSPATIKVCSGRSSGRSGSTTQCIEVRTHQGIGEGLLYDVVRVGGRFGGPISKRAAKAMDRYIQLRSTYVNVGTEFGVKTSIALGIAFSVNVMNRH